MQDVSHRTRAIALVRLARVSRSAVAGVLLVAAELSWGQVACQLPQAIKAPAARQPDWRNPDVPTDYLALVLSWSPEHCAKQTSAAQRAKHAFQCQLNSFEFVVHGLWPQSRQANSAQDHPRHCKASGPLPVELVKRHLCAVPGAELMQNEWQAHGTCAWPDAPAYFDTIEVLLGQIKRPAFSVMTGAGTAAGMASMSSAAIRKAFVDANPGKLVRENVRVSVGSGNRLKEVWICLSSGNDPQPIACPAGGTPDGQLIKVRAPRQQVTPPPSPPDVGEPPDAADVACPARQGKFGGYSSAAKQALWSMYPNGGKEIYCEAPFSAAASR